MHVLFEVANEIFEQMKMGRMSQVKCYIHDSA